jgi:hypothetical protein
MSHPTSMQLGSPQLEKTNASAACGLLGREIVVYADAAVEIGASFRSRALTTSGDCPTCVMPLNFIRFSLKGWATPSNTTQPEISKH